MVISAELIGGSADLAGSAAGMIGLRKPWSLPEGLAFEKAAVTGRGEARLTLYPEANHDSWDPAIAEPDLPAWILEQRSSR